MGTRYDRTSLLESRGEACTVSKNRSVSSALAQNFDEALGVAPFASKRDLTLATRSSSTVVRFSGVVVTANAIIVGTIGRTIRRRMVMLVSPVVAGLAVLGNLHALKLPADLVRKLT